MAEGGDNLGLATLQLAVDLRGLDDGLDLAQQRIAAFNPEFKGISAAIAEIGAQLDAALSKFGQLGGVAAPATQGVAPASGGGTVVSRPSGEAISGSVEEKKQTQESQKQTAEERKQTELQRRQTALLGKSARTGPATQASENRLLRFADSAVAPDSGATLRQLRRSQGLLQQQRESLPGGTDRSRRLTDSINALGRRIDTIVKVGRETQGFERVRPNARERLRNFQTPAIAQVDALEARGAPQKRIKELRDLLGRIFDARNAERFGLADRLRGQFESARRTTTVRQSTAERTAINDRRTSTDEFRAREAIKNQQFEINRAKARGVEVSKAQLQLDKASELAAEGRKLEVNEAVAAASRERRAAGDALRDQQRRAREERTRNRERETLRDRGSRLDRDIRKIETRSPEFLRRAGVSPQLLRRDLGAVREAQAQGTRTGDFESARTLGGELRRRLTSSLDKIKALEAELDASVRNAPRVSARGRVADVGSPAFAVRGASQGGARESLRTPDTVAQKRFDIERKINALAERGADVSAARNRLQALASAQSNGEFGTARKISSELSRQVTLLEEKQRKQEKVSREADRELSRQARIGGAAEPVKGRATLEGSPRAAEQERRRQIAQAPSIGGLERGRAAERIADDLQTRVTRLRSQGFDTAPFEKGIQDARKKLVEGQLLGARRQLEDISRRVSADESFATNDRQLRTSFQQQQRQADRRATTPAQTLNRGVKDAEFERLTSRLETLDSIGGDTAKFRARLDKARQQLYEGNIVAVERELTKLGSQISRTTNQQRIANRQAKQPQQFENAQQALAFAPRIETPAQLKSYEAALKKLQSQTSVTDDAFDPLNAVLKQVSAALKGGTKDAAAFAGALKRIREGAARVRAPELGAPLPPPRPSPEERRRALEAADEQRQRRQRAPLPPQPGLLERGRSLLADRDFRQRAGGALSSGIIGGGFPLLFGQGAGASLGGLLGGLGGGALGGGFGFALSILGTNIGAAIDSLVQRFGTLADALRDPIAQLDAFIQNATLASDAQERYVQALVGAGRTTEAAQVVRDEAGRTIDPGAVLLLSDAQDRYNRTLSDAQDILGNLIAGPASQFLNFLTDLAKSLGAVPQQGPRALTGPTALRDARNEQRAGVQTFGVGATTALAGLALTAANPLIGLGVAGAGLLATQVGRGQVGSGAARERVANSEEVKRVEADIEATNQRQLAVQQQINAAKAAGKNETAAALEQSKELAAIDQRRNQAELEAQAAFAALRPKQQADPANQGRRDDAIKLANEIAKIESEALVSTQRGITANSQRELDNAQRLVGLSGQRLQIEQSRIAVEAAARNRDSSNQQLRDVQVARSNGAASDDEVTLALERQKQAELDYTRVVIQENEKRRLASLNSIANARTQLDDLNNEQVRVDVDSSEFAFLGQQIVQTQQELDNLEAKETTVRVQYRLQGLQDGSVTASLSNLERQIQDTTRQRQLAIVGSQEFEQLSTQLRELNNLREAADQSLKPASNSLRDAGISIRDDSEEVKQNLEAASQSLRSALEGSFRFLTRERQQEVLATARDDIKTGVKAGFIDQRFSNTRRPEEVLAIAQAARSLLGASDQLRKASLPGLIPATPPDLPPPQQRKEADITANAIAAAIRTSQATGTQQPKATEAGIASRFENGVAIIGQELRNLTTEKVQGSALISEPIDQLASRISQLTQPNQAGQPTGFDLVASSNQNVAATLGLVNATLVSNIEAIAALAAKDWSVNVNVPGGTASGDVIGAVTGYV